MYRYKDIKMVHLEVTSLCNAGCPMCARNIRGGKINPHLPLQDLKLADVQRIFPPDFVRQLKKIYLCGNYGDPVAGRETLEILEYFRSVHPEINLGLHTNGGVRDTSWWSRLAQVVSYCRFGIDGLEDTNHLYRQGVKWEALVSHVQAFVQAGGRAEWDYLVFKHNQHQIEQARELANNWGFQSFQVKSTSRFFDSKRGTVAPSYEVQNSQGQTTHLLEPSDLPDFQNKALEDDFHRVVKDFGSMERYWDLTEIDCRVADEKSVYVSAEGFVYPCCWTANQMYSGDNPKGSALWGMLQMLPEKERSLRAQEKSIEQIVESEFFQRILPESWNAKSVAAGKLQVCAKTCGKCVKPFESQFVSR